MKRVQTMNLVPLSRSQAEKAILQSHDGAASVAICIAYPNGRLHKVRAFGSLLAVHHTRFSDCDGEAQWSFPDGKDPNGEHPTPMTFGQAIDVLAFVEQWREKVSTIYAACYGGVSRSRGVLAGLAAVYGWDDRELYASGQPNAWCKTLILRAARANLEQS